ncbi:protein translocase subunit SecD [Bowmanella yangjiangensis]|uniref:Multifunctional fusion protein n=1 Tax=Bowmanella yangjiangensis TaxID=2811230 RepID=A0ABS3CNJ6_9ALTE|nr:protein translocase subunit SecD [Bowmanella yangjiangensis]MBN7818683.1 protein translocase subunit SecD [Bowmanella yangjiangensis]
MNVFSMRAFGYVLIMLLGLLSAAPNLLPTSVANKLPDWYSHNTLALGLDLQGGSHLLLEADTQALFKQQLDDASDQLLSALREQHIRYSRGDNNQPQQRSFVLKDVSQWPQVAKLAASLSLLNNGRSGISLELQGNKVVMQLSEAFQQALLKDAIDRSLDVVRKRLNETGLTEPSITRQGKDAILVQMPGVSDPQQIKALLGTTAQMSFHWQQPSPSGALMVKDRQGTPYFLETRVALEGTHIVDAQAAFSQESGQPVVNFKLDSQGAKLFGDMTKSNIGRVLAIVLDDEVVTAPVIRSAIPGGRGEISGSFTMAEAHDVALMLRTGALPVPLTVVEERTVGPDLGSDAIHMGVTTGILGAALVLVYMLVAYGGWGLIACVGLSVNIGLVFGLLSLFGATLTLPGIAGLILTIGMAVDANILINERIKEETRKGRPAGIALKAGFDKAFATIIDSNFTTLIAVSLLFMFGSGPVKGFAVTIALGLLTSLFTSVSLTRLLMQWRVKGKERQPMPMGGLDISRWMPKKEVNFLRGKVPALCVSVALTLLSIGLFFKPGLHYGVDFTGGIMMEVHAPGMAVDDLRSAIERQGLGEIAIQEYGAEHEFLLRAANSGGDSPAPKVVEQLKATIIAANADASFPKVDVVGPKVSGEFADLSILALLIAGGGMLAYLWLRFEAHFAVAALATIGLDLTKTIGFFALTGIEFNLTAVAALLALLGYSINDKVVVFDRVRELFRLEPEADIDSLMNRAVTSTLTRTLYTSVTTFLALLPMGIAGGDAVNSFALPMLFAVVIGTSSTIFIATPILSILSKRRAAKGKPQLRPTAEEIQQELAHLP